MKLLWIVLAVLLVTGCVVAPAPYTADVYGPSVSVGVGAPVYYAYPYYRHHYYYPHPIRTGRTVRTFAVEDDMQERPGLSALAVIGMTAVAISAFSAQLPGTPEDATTPPSRSQQGAVQKSDQHRIVGKVLQIDREQGLVKLATEEGALVVQAPPPMVLAVNVGDVISVPRSVAEAPSASPRE